MLRYSIKLGDDEIKQISMVWSERFLSPDLSFVSGVTSQDYHLDLYKKLSVSNNLLHINGSHVFVESNDVIRQGYIIIKNKEYEVISKSMTDYSSENIEVRDYKYIFINGKYYYLNDGKFVIDKWLVEKYNLDESSYIAEEEKVIPYVDGDTVNIDTIVWIEDGLVNIDGNVYFYDKNEQVNDDKNGGLKYFQNGACLEDDEITKCEKLIYKPFKLSNEYLKVTKFVLTKTHDNIEENFDKIAFCARHYYVNYKEHYYSIKQKFNEDGYNFVCEIGTEEPFEFPLYNADDNTEITEANFSSHGVHDLSDLYKVSSYIIIDNSKVFVNNEIINGSDGREILVYLKDLYNTVDVGDEIIFTDTSSVFSIQQVYTHDEYDFDSSDSCFIVYNGNKYKVINNLCDKVLINNDEYSIDYINGKIENEDCLVLIGDEQVPMKITKDGDNFVLARYGYIVDGDGKSFSSNVIYPIKSYDGVIINGKNYIVNGEETDSIRYISLDKSNKYTFVATDKISSNLIVCKLLTNNVDYTDDFILHMEKEACDYIVSNQKNIILNVRNKIFGSKEITSDLALKVKDNPTSSDDYYNLLDNLEIYVRNGYLDIPIKLSSQQGNNIMQDDLVNNLFFEKEKKKAINPIIDMEKNIYSPKFIDNKNVSDDDKNKYFGSDTDFSPIEEIRVNLHFRTRNLISWKVNEAFNNAATSGVSDNWFVTDFHPYKDILDSDINDDEKNQKLMESSDLLGLMFFTNEDVFYQKKKISNSFLRFSFYDSIDSQTQNLLATSTIFMNGHKLYKTFIDNSRKYMGEYVEVVGQDIDSVKIFNKIAVDTEYLGSKKDNENTNTIENNTYTNVILDDKHRIGSEFIISNKYETETSSEGFYIYMFKEYSENLHPKPIYMKVEFNHAGIGRTIPFIVPMKWEEAGNNKVPTRTLTLIDGTSDDDKDLTELKKGIKLEDVYAQSYIPLYAVYDFKNKEYGYVFDERYVTIKKNETDEHEKAVLNLFELKVMDDQTTSENIQKDITYRKQKTAIINVNPNMFPNINL